MDVYSANRSQLNTSRIRKIDEKSIVFVVAAPLPGLANDEIEFPYDGELKLISLSCKTPGATPTEILVQRCSAANYSGAGPLWEDLVPTPITLPKDEKVVHTVITGSKKISSGDFIRVLFNAVGVSATNFVVRADIELNIEN